MFGVIKSEKLLSILLYILTNCKKINIASSNVNRYTVKGYNENIFTSALTSAPFDMRSFATSTKPCLAAYMRAVIPYMKQRINQFILLHPSNRFLTSYIYIFIFGKQL
jgi:hypothetical protein